jgi:transposase-like protein/IS1 family transposase
MEFMREYPDDAACLDWLWRERYSADGHTTYCPTCDQDRRFSKVADRPAWDCNHCGHHLHPLAGTIFHKSSTSLHLWFFAIHLMTSTRCGVSAKQLERELGVTYKTAWRMFNLIRNELMADDGTPLSGEVEVDETSVEGRPRKHLSRSEAARYRERSRATVLAAVERGGRVRATVLESRRGPELKRQVIEWVRPEAIVYTDEWPAYNRLGDHFAAHSRVVHSAGEYVRGDWHTNTIEGFFGNLKTGIRGNYKKVSRRWLQGYLNEFTWRYNHRHDPRSMFRALLLRAAAGR